MRCDPRSDRGAVTTEIVIVLPILIALLFLVVAAGRLTDARSDVTAAARDAARMASLQRSAGAADVQAARAAADTVANERLNCRNGPTTQTDYEPGVMVHVVVSCTVDLRDLGFIAAPIPVRITGEAREPIDVHRSEAAP